MIGLDPLPARTLLQPTVVRTIERKEYTIEVLYFQSMPRFYVTANLYKPKKGGERFPAVVWGPGVQPMDGTDADELSRAEVDARLRVYEDLATKQAEHPELAGAQVVETPPLLGIRQTRFVG